tara:strand:+ start:209 stop:580 length:372 start_codon:yes stop_codon:yes gene_type:complete
MIQLNLSDRNSNLIADRINNFHSLLTLYVLFGWISTYHSKILTLFIPSLFMNWLVDDNECCINHIERYFRIEGKKDKEDKEDKVGFIESKLRLINIELSEKNLNKIICIISYSSFLISYYRLN